VFSSSPKLSLSPSPARSFITEALEKERKKEREKEIQLYFFFLLRKKKGVLTKRRKKTKISRKP